MHVSKLDLGTGIFKTTLLFLVAVSVKPGAFRTPRNLGSVSCFAQWEIQPCMAVTLNICILEKVIRMFKSMQILLKQSKSHRTVQNK